LAAGKLVTFNQGACNPGFGISPINIDSCFQDATGYPRRDDLGRICIKTGEPRKTYWVAKIEHHLDALINPGGVFETGQVDSY